MESQFLVAVIQLLQERFEPGWIIRNDVYQKYRAQGQEKNGKVQQKDTSAKQNSVLPAHDCLPKLKG